MTEITYRPAEAADGADDLIVRRFEYDARGRLLTETDAVGGAIDYRITSDKTGSTLTTAAGTDDSPAETIRYDPRLRPMEANYADGTVARWHYPTNGGSEMEVGLGDNTAPIRLTESADHRSHRLQVGDEYRIDSQYDTAGRLITLAENDRTLLRQDWTPDGRLKVTSSEAQAEHYEYDEDGLVSRILLTPPDAEGQLDRWQETRLDPEGRPLQVKDYRGQHLSMAYDDRGQLTDMITHRDDKRYGYQIERNDAGRIQRVASSWGNQDYVYDPDGRVEALNIERDGASAAAKWDSGLLKRVKQFDGGEVSLAYIEDGDQAGMLKGITTPNALELAYRYDDEDRLTEVSIGQRTRMLLDYDAKDRLTGWSYQAAER